MHNSQPWRWRVVDEATIELYADRRRQLQVSDPSGRNLALSCGAAIHHGFVAAQALGLTAAVELMPLRDDENLLARISLTPGTRTDEALETLRALEERRTDRRRFTSWPIPDSRLAHLAKAASGWGAHAIPITDVTARFRAEELLKRAMAVQASDPRFAEEQREWTVHSRVEGMPMANAAPPAHGRPPTRPNRFASASDAEATEAADAARVVESSDGLVAICSAADDQRVVAGGGTGTQRPVAAGHPRRPLDRATEPGRRGRRDPSGTAPGRLRRHGPSADPGPGRLVGKLPHAASTARHGDRSTKSSSADLT